MSDINWGSVGTGAASGAAAGSAFGPWGAVIGGVGGAVVGGITGSKASGQLQKAQENARNAIQEGTKQAAGYQQPMYDTGMKNLGTLDTMVNNGSFNVNPYSYTDSEQQPGAYKQTAFNYQEDPGYQFQIAQGQNAIQNSAAAGGGLLSGATLKALQNYGVGAANQNYNDVYNRYLQGNQLGLAVNQNAYGQYNSNRSAGMTNELNRYNSANQQSEQNYNRYNNLAQMGVGAGNNLSNLYNQQGQSLASSYLGTGQAQAGGTMAVGNAINQGLNTIGRFADAYGQQNRTANNPNYSNSSTPWTQGNQSSPFDFSNSAVPNYAASGESNMPYTGLSGNDNFATGDNWL